MSGMSMHDLKRYITLVEHPARMQCGTLLAATEFGPSYKRAAVMQAALAVVIVALIMAGPVVLPTSRDPAPRRVDVPGSALSISLMTSENCVTGLPSIRAYDAWLVYFPRYDRSLWSDATEGLLLPSPSWYSDHLSDEPSDAVVFRRSGRRVDSDCAPGPHHCPR